MGVRDLLEQLIRIDSANPFDCREIDPDEPATWWVVGNEIRIAEFLERQLAAAGFSVRRQTAHTGPDGTPHCNLLAEKGTGRDALLYLGHMDTVTARPWLSLEEALTPRRETREVRGRAVEVVRGLGANDMKAGLAATLSALADFHPDGYRLKVAFVVDEEYYSIGGYVLSRSDFLDDVRAVVVPETGDGPNSAWGPRAIGLGRLGRCEYVLEVPGTGGHGAQAHDPAHISAAAQCARLVEAIESLRREYRLPFEFFRGEVPDAAASRDISGSVYVSRVEAGDGSLSIPSAGRVIVSFQLTPGVTVASCGQLLAELVAAMYADGRLAPVRVSGTPQPVRIALRRRPTPFNEAFATPEDHPFTLLARQSVDATVGFQAFNMGWSNADENLIAMARPGLPILNLSPLGLDCHRAGEWVGVESLRQLTEILRDVAVRFGPFLRNGPGS